VKGFMGGGSSREPVPDTSMQEALRRDNHAHTEMTASQIAAQSMGRFCSSELLHEGEDALPTAGTVSSMGMFINMLTAGLGTSILAFPWGVAGASVVSGIFLVVFILVVNMWTIGIVVRAGEEHQSFDLGTLLMKLPGRMGSTLQMTSNGLVWLTLWLTLLSYVITVQNNMILVMPGGAAQNRVLWAVLTASVAYPLSYVPQKYLSFTSSVSVAVIIFLFGVLIQTLASESEPQHNVCGFGTGPGVVTYFSVLMNSVIIQMCVLPMYAELKDRTPAKFNLIVNTAFGTLILLFCAFATVGYMAFGNDVDSMITDNLKKGPLGSVVHVGISLVILCTFPIFVIPMVAPVAAFEGKEGIWCHVARAVICASVMVAAFFVTQFGMILAINGALCVGFFIGLLPGLVGLYLTPGKGAGWRVLMWTLIVFALAGSVLGFIFTDNEVKQLHCWWWISK